MTVFITSLRQNSVNLFHKCSASDLFRVSWKYDAIFFTNFMLIYTEYNRLRMA